MSDEYFEKALAKIITVDDDDDFVAKTIVTTARQIYDEAQALKPVDPRLSDDPLTALKAVCEHHNIAIESSGGVSVWSDNALILDFDGSTLTADDIDL